MSSTEAWAETIQRVPRTRREAKQLYDHISTFYGPITQPFEGSCTDRGLEVLAIREGEAVLEIGFGPGHALRRIAEQVGEAGKAYGLDISWGMVKLAMKRLVRCGLEGRVNVCCGDALRLPYRSSVFDAAFMSFTLELFDTPDIPVVLGEIKRVLRPKGRLSVASMSKEGQGNALLKLYEWAHDKWPRYFDCRPIFAERSLRRAGYTIAHAERVDIFGSPVEIVVAKKSQK